MRPLPAPYYTWICCYTGELPVLPEITYHQVLIHCFGVALFQVGVVGGDPLQTITIYLSRVVLWGVALYVHYHNVKIGITWTYDLAICMYPSNGEWSVVQMLRGQ